MKQKILVLTMAMALILTSACGSKESGKDKKDKTSATTAEEADNSEKEAEASEKDSEKDAGNGAAESATKGPTENTGSPADTTEETDSSSPTDSTEETTTVPTETSERDEAECVYDLTSMTAEEIADICDSLTQREIPKVGDLMADVRSNYYDVEPWRYTLAFCGRYGGSDNDNVNCIYVSGVSVEGTEDDGGPYIRSVDRFGTGIVLDIYDYEKAQEFIRIMRERHPVLEEKPGGSWRSEDFLVGITPIDFFYYENGMHFQIAYGEGSDWYESVSGFFGFGMEITVGTDESETTPDQQQEVTPEQEQANA